VSSRRQYARLLEPLLAQAAGYARSILRTRQDAEDAVQQAALRGLERIDTFDAGRPFKGWWFAILRNCCFDILRQLKAAKTETLDNYEPAFTGASDAVDWRDLSVAMNRLTHDHSEILRLRYFADLNYVELAEALNIPHGTVMSRLHLARKALLAHMPQEDS
jgi:RNA polymerase sigma-70 factor, ECF subfamily